LGRTDFLQNNGPSETYVCTHRTVKAISDRQEAIHDSEETRGTYKTVRSPSGAPSSRGRLPSRKTFFHGPELWSVRVTWARLVAPCDVGVLLRGTYPRFQ